MTENFDLTCVTVEEFKNLSITKTVEQILHSSSKHFVLKKLFKKEDLAYITRYLNQKSHSSWKCSSPTLNSDKYEGWIWSDSETSSNPDDISLAGDVKKELFLREYQLFLTTNVPHKIKEQKPLEDRIRIASWNAEKLTFNKASEASDFIRKFIFENNISIIAIQEIVSKEADKAINEIVDSLNSFSGSESPWRCKISQIMGKIRGKEEVNAFIWNSSLNIQLTRTGLCAKEFSQAKAGWQWKEHARRPFYGLFKIPGRDVLLVSVHVIYGDSPSRRQEEVKALPETVQKISEGAENIVILGDFNLEPTNIAFKVLQEHGYVKALSENQKTNVVESNTKGTMSYDNFWLKSKTLTFASYGVIRDGFEFGKAPSDHCPVWAEIPVKCNKQTGSYSMKKESSQIYNNQHVTRNAPKQRSASKQPQAASMVGFNTNQRNHQDLIDFSTAIPCDPEEITQQTTTSASSEFICPNCGRDCHARIGLHSHMKKCSKEHEAKSIQPHHYGAPLVEYACPDCYIKFSNQSSLDSHLKVCSYYLENKRLQSQRFLSPTSPSAQLYEYVDSDSEKATYSPISGYSRPTTYQPYFEEPTPSSYQQYSSYSSEFICPNCGRDCHARIGLYSHMKKCTREFEEINSRPQYTSARQSSEFICPNCGRDCHARIGLYSHMRKCKG